MKWLEIRVTLNIAGRLVINLRELFLFYCWKVSSYGLGLFWDWQVYNTCCQHSLAGCWLDLSSGWCGSSPSFHASLCTTVHAFFCFKVCRLSSRAILRWRILVSGVSLVKWDYKCMFLHFFFFLLQWPWKVFVDKLVFWTDGPIRIFVSFKLRRLGVDWRRLLYSCQIELSTMLCYT